MRSRCSLITCMALLTTAIMLVSAPATLHAQAANCAGCDFFKIKVDSDVKCNVTIWWKLMSQDPMESLSMPAAQELWVPCNAFLVGMYDCYGNFHVILGAGAPTPCTPGFPIPTNCCVRVCITTDTADGCPIARISNADCYKLCSS